MRQDLNEMRVGLCRYPGEEPSRQRAKQMQSTREGRLLSQSEEAHVAVGGGGCGEGRSGKRGEAWDRGP